MKAASVRLLLATVLIATGSALSADPPAQFRVWGSAGPEMAPPPEGWTEEAPQAEGLPPLIPTPDEERRGYVLFARDPFATIPPTCVPAPSERITELQAFCTLGEYEPVSFGIHALHDLDDVGVSVAELRSLDGGAVPADRIDVRVVRCVRAVSDAKAQTYRLAPFLLERRDPFSVPQGRSAQVWLTVKVPEAVAGGEYVGSVSVQPNGGDRADVTLRLRVLPLALPPAPVEMALFVPRPAESDDLPRKELIDLREHGMTALQPAPGVEIESRDQHFGDDDIAATRARCRRIMGMLKEVYGGWRFPVTFEVGHQIAYYWDQERNWFAFWPHSPEIENDLFRAIQVVKDIAEEDGWPPLRVYALDEAGAHNLLDEAVYYYGLIKQRMPELTTWTTIGGGMAMGHDEIGQLSPVVDFLSTNRFTPEIARALVERGKPYGIYNGAGSTPAGARFFFGFYGWKTGAQEVSQWVYSFGDAVFEGSGLRAADEGYVYYAPDGPLPSLMWEAAREGVDDYRYLSALWAAIATAKKASQSTEAAEDELRDIMAQIPWTFQALDSGDRTPPPHPSALRKWRWRVAKQLLALQDVAAAPPGPQEPVARSPFDWEWATAGQPVLAYGDELLPPSDFEAEMEPWRVEAWNGQGSGELDPAAAHHGEQSVRIDIPKQSGSESVTVLVWPRWGGGGLDLTLAGDRMYELSARVKLEGRNTPPDLRIALPQDAEKAVSSGKSDPDANGWQRVWKRTELAFPAQPNYLAVWVQGPGTVWVDDLSLREAIPPPLEVSLDQDEYDGADRLAIATVMVTKRVSPAKVRFVVTPAEGQPVGELTAPFRTQAPVAAVPVGTDGSMTLLAPTSLNEMRLVFDPSRLEPGVYRAAVQLLDTRDAVIAEEVAKFRRVE